MKSPITVKCINIVNELVWIDAQINQANINLYNILIKNEKLSTKKLTKHIQNKQNNLTKQTNKQSNNQNYHCLMSSS